MKIPRYRLLLVAFFLGIAFVWFFLDRQGVLQNWENRWMDVNFLYRGPIESSQPVVYVNLDLDSLDILDAESFLPREYYAWIAEGALVLGGARGVLFDVIFKDFEGENADAFNLDYIREDAALFGQTVQNFPDQIVLACNYSEHNYVAGKPELAFPPWPIFMAGPEGWGIPGLIGRTQVESRDQALRVMPWGVEMPSSLILSPGTPGIEDMDPRMKILNAGLAIGSIGVEGLQIEKGKDRLILSGTLEGKAYRREIPLVEGQMEVNWYSQWVSVETEDGHPDLYLQDPYNPMVSVGHVVKKIADWLWASENNPEEARAIEGWFRTHFEGRLVFVGPTDPYFGDRSPTPIDIGPVPRVSVYGNIAKMLADERFIVRMPEWFLFLFLPLMYLYCLFVLRDQNSNIAIGAGKVMAILILYVVFALELFKQFGVALPVAGPVSAAFAESAAIIGLRLWRTELQKRRITKLFGTYVSRDVVRQMVNAEVEPRLGGERTEITAFFSDIEDFTRISEVMEPEKLVNLMNTYLDAMTTELEAARGTLDKTIGDAIVAIFGAPVPLPVPAAAAMQVAVAMQEQQARLREIWKNSEEEFPEGVYRMETRIGFHLGPAIVGNMGSQKRFTYTMMGDTVNLAARLEGCCKHYGVRILTTLQTVKASGAEKEKFLLRELDCIRVMGRSEAVTIFELIDARSACSDNDFNCVEAYAYGLKAYREQLWEEAQHWLSKAETLERRNGDKANPSRVLYERVGQFASHPPPVDWDGSFNLASK